VKILWSPEARDDLIGVFERILSDDPGAAVVVLKRIETLVERLRDHPALGRPGTVSGTRELVITGTPYIVAYRTDEPGRAIHVLAARHGARLWPEAFE
jgi:addiction module RelE/StbE family toxin